jgi:hypothetical protein
VQSSQIWGRKVAWERHGKSISNRKTIGIH